MSKRRVAAMRLGLSLLVLIATIGVAGCRAHAQAGPQTAKGLIVNVQARSIAETEAITLRADDGRELVLRVDRGVDFTPGHLREHMALGQPVVVTFEPTPDGLLAVKIDDA